MLKSLREIKIWISMKGATQTEFRTHKNSCRICRKLPTRFRNRDIFL